MLSQNSNKPKNSDFSQSCRNDEMHRILANFLMNEPAIAIRAYRSPASMTDALFVAP
jgi:hypothetical protein